MFPYKIVFCEHLLIKISNLNIMTKKNIKNDIFQVLVFLLTNNRKKNI